MARRVRFSLDPNTEPTAPDGAPGVSYGIVEGSTVFETESLWSDRGGAGHPLDEVRLLPPCRPTKVVCVGRNYREHASELGNPVPAEPLIFLKPVSSLLGHMDDIVYPPISQRVDYEGELGLVIGRRVRNLKRDEAAGAIFGYTCVNDVTARDLQKRDGQWTRGKGFDTFCPVGPWIVTRGELRLEDVRVRTFVDNEKRQDASLQELIFPLGRIIEFVTEFMTLEPGDLIATGTPSGVGPLAPGSVVRVVIEGVGALENRVVKL
jgi:2-keto-4-pentenoate hydratase/2-oxohepta-3-ene-1,7-dioic acid hydratase in catechol pathway